MRLLNAIKDYKLPSVLIGDMTLSEVAPIFERINSSGRVLRFVDLMRAATWKEGFDLSDAIDKIRSSLEQKNFDTIEESHILRNISASLNEGIHKDAMEKIRYKSASELAQAARNTHEAYNKAVDFLTMELPVASYACLPYALQLTLLVEFFRKNNNPDAHVREILKKWFWHTSLGGRYGSVNTGVLTQELDNIRKLATGNLDIFDNHYTAVTPKLMDVKFRLNYATSKAFALLLAENNPKSLLNGASVDIITVLSKINRNEFHHIFPKDYLKSQGYTESDINKHANICMLSLIDNRKISNKKPSLYFVDLQNQLGGKFNQILESNYIDDVALKYLLVDDYENFIRQRSQLVMSRVGDITISTQLRKTVKNENASDDYSESGWEDIED